MNIKLNVPEVNRNSFKNNVVFEYWYVFYYKRGSVINVKIFEKFEILKIKSKDNCWISIIILIKAIHKSIERCDTPVLLEVYIILF